MTKTDIKIDLVGDGGDFILKLRCRYCGALKDCLTLNEWGFCNECAEHEREEANLPEDHRYLPESKMYPIEQLIDLYCIKCKTSYRRTPVRFSSLNLFPQIHDLPKGWAVCGGLKRDNTLELTCPRCK